MNRTCFLLIIIVSAHCHAQNLWSWGDYGTTTVYAGGNKSVQLILTDNARQRIAQQYAATLSQEGNLVAVLNTDVYLNNISQRKASCFDAATPLSVYVQDLQTRYKSPHFEQAFITGFGTAGSLVFVMLSEIPKGIFKGAYSIDAGAAIRLPADLCRSHNAISWKNPETPLQIDFTQQLPTPWTMPNKTPWLNHILAPSYTSTWPIDRKKFEEKIEYEDHLKQNNSKKNNDISSLPLIEVPANPKGKYANSEVMAIIISGDGGWANIDKDIANSLASNGIPAIGWNSLEYFWEKKTPDIAGKDLQNVIAHYSRHWNKKEFLLIGYSMGADVIPFMVNRLDAQTRSRLLSVNLLNPATRVDFTFHLSEWLHTKTEAPYALYPEVAHWSEWNSNCFHSEMKDSLCEEIKKTRPDIPTSQRFFYLPGDHHFDGNYQQLTTLILEHSAINQGQ
jgi:type IV secretory pathway VirJ component